MDDLNVCTISGNLTADPELKTTKYGKEYLSFRIANHLYVNGKRRVYFYQVELFGQSVKNSSTSIKKGSNVILSGFIHPHHFTYEKTGKEGMINIMVANTIRWVNGSFDVSFLTEGAEEPENIDVTI